MSHFATNLLAASLLVLAVLVLRHPVARLFGARAAFALWLVPGIRLLMPPLPAMDGLSSAAAPGVIDLSIVVRQVSDPTTQSGVNWILWALGAAAFLAYHLVAHLLFLRRALCDGRPFDAPGATCDVITSAAVDGPAATGLVHRLILLPTDFETRFSPEQQRIALLHETLHHRRGDLWASALALVGAAALWFNPLTYLALGAFRRDMEAACDASLLATPGASDPATYGETILRSAARPVPRSLCALTSLDELKGRLTMLNANHGTPARLAGLGVVGALTAAGIAIGAPASANHPEGEHKTVERKIVIHNGADGPAGATWEGKDGEVRDIKCPGTLTVIESSPTGAAEKKQQAKLAFCSKSADRADVVAGLEKALANLRNDSEMDAAIKADLTAKLSQKIAEVKAGG
jgi:beta-lactamase regulating signal transducer with metallopeptidase domain